MNRTNTINHVGLPRTRREKRVDEYILLFLLNSQRMIQTKIAASKQSLRFNRVLNKAHFDSIEREGCFETIYWLNHFS